MRNLLAVENLSVKVPGPAGPVPVINDVSFHIGEGEIIGLAGESGSGKSMTAATLMNLLPRGADVRGALTFCDEPLYPRTEREWRALRGRDIAMVFQDSASALHPMLTVGTQMTEHMRTHLGLGRRAARQRAIELLDQVRIPDPQRALSRYPHQFSGGMRQRVAIATALACDPKLLIADESTTALDVTVQAGILALLSRLRSEMGLSVLFVAHDLGVLAALTDRTYVLYAGRVMESGPTTRVLTQPYHPYTAALLAARPHGGGTSGRGELRPIPGNPTTPADAPRGCPFSPRCIHVRDECLDRPPAMRGDGAGHGAACVLDAGSAQTAVQGNKPASIGEVL